LKPYQMTYLLLVVALLLQAPLCLHAEDQFRSEREEMVNERTVPPLYEKASEVLNGLGYRNVRFVPFIMPDGVED